MSTIDEMADILYERTDPDVPVTEFGILYHHAPATVFGMRYSETVVVDFDRGRWPEWFVPFAPRFRQLDNDPSYGFYEMGYCAIPKTAMVLDRTSRDSYMLYRMRQAAKDAGWWTEGRGDNGFVCQNMAEDGTP